MEDLQTVQTSLLSLAAVVAFGIAVQKVVQRIGLSMAKHPSLAGHLRMAKRFAKWVPGYAYQEANWLSSDGAPLDVIRLREQGLIRLSNSLKDKSSKTLQASAEVKPLVSDLQLISQYRVPFQFTPVLQQHITLGSFWESSKGSTLRDLDGNAFIDVTGSYGVNVLGMDFYKQCIDQGNKIAGNLGPVLGSYHPCVLENAQMLCELSGMDEVSFHMSGTEAVMQAVRLARYHTGKKKIVRFTGAYHGWWDDVQPGPGNPMPPSSHTLTLNDMHENTLRVLRSRNDIACVLINPIQAMHPNKAAPTDSTLVDSSRNIQYDKERYQSWLNQLRAVCTEKGIALILDEVFLGFRLARGGAQAYFNVRADLVTYGKTLGGGLPVGVVCGSAQWMKRFNDQKPADLCFARGTFNAHPYVMATMNAFLKFILSEDGGKLYKQAAVIWPQRMEGFNQRMAELDLPVQMGGMESIWSVMYKVPSRYNWMLQFYLRDHGIALSWIGTGRLIFNFGMTDDEFDAFVNRFTTAVQQMKTDGWWWTQGEVTNKTIRQSLFREIVREKFKRAIKTGA